MIKMLKGGFYSSDASSYKFVSAAVTDTRLMGVIGLRVAFKDQDTNDESLQQFYYFDYEEFGLEHMKFLFSDSYKEISTVSQSFFAGLGAQMVELNEREAVCLAQWMINNTKERGLRLPPEYFEVKFVMDMKADLDEDEIKALMAKLCTPIKTDYGAVNYFLMRCFGNDYEGAKLLLEDGVDIKSCDVTPKKRAAFLRNKISSEETISEGYTRYRCESLIELDDRGLYYLIESSVDVRDKKIAAAEHISTMAVSSFEASLLLNKTEYITTFSVKKGPTAYSFPGGFKSMMLGKIRSEHDSGVMFMDYKPDNSHVENKLFLLSNDVNAIYFITKRGQVIVTAYSPEDIKQAEVGMMWGPIRTAVELEHRYTFPASIMYDYAESGMPDFYEFLKFLEE